MFGKRDDTATAGTYTSSAAVEPRARGGVAFGPILTGVVVAFGAMFLLSALVGGVMASLGLIEDEVTSGEAIEAGLGAGMALVVAQFLSYLWGGYTAGRMARGSGIANGSLVPLTALIVGAIVVAIATGLGANANLNLPFTTNQLQLDEATLVDWGVGIGIASLIAMFLGGALGGGMGARWHTKLERNVAEERADAREVEVREHRGAETTTTATSGASKTTPDTQGVADAKHEDRSQTSPLKR